MTIIKVYGRVLSKFDDNSIWLSITHYKNNIAHISKYMQVQYHMHYREFLTIENIPTCVHQGDFIKLKLKSTIACFGTRRIEIINYSIGNKLDD
jgi:hypothetical protein